MLEDSLSILLDMLVRIFSEKIGRSVEDLSLMWAAPSNRLGARSNGRVEEGSSVFYMCTSFPNRFDYVCCHPWESNYRFLRIWIQTESVAF